MAGTLNAVDGFVEGSGRKRIRRKRACRFKLFYLIMEIHEFFAYDA